MSEIDERNQEEHLLFSFKEERQRFGAKVKELFGESDAGGLLIEVLDFIYETPEGRNFSFKSVLPQGWKLLRKTRDTLEADTENREIIYGDHQLLLNNYSIPEGEPLPESIETDELMRRVDVSTRMVMEVASPPQMDRKGFFISLLHEFGHAHAFEAMSSEDKQRSLEARGKLVYKKKNEMTEEERSLHQKYIVQNEKDAWQWALEKLQELRNMRVNLAPEITTNEEMYAAIEGALTTYERDLSPEAWAAAVDAARYKTDKT